MSCLPIALQCGEDAGCKPDFGGDRASAGCAPSHSSAMRAQPSANHKPKRRLEKSVSDCDLGCSPRADPDRLHSRLVPAGRLENRHAPDGLAVAPARLLLGLQPPARLLRSGPLRGTARAFHLTHSSSPCPRPTLWQWRSLVWRLRGIRSKDAADLQSDPHASMDIERSSQPLGQVWPQKRLPKALNAVRTTLSTLLEPPHPAVVLT